MMSVQEKHRLFFALWPDEALAAKLHSLAQTIATTDTERVIAASLIHLTLRYVGNVDVATQGCLETMAQNIRVANIEFTLQSQGYWKKPRVIWTAPESWSESLDGLVSQIEQGCQHCGLEAEKRKFSPHVTLIRKASRSPAVKMQIPLLWRTADFVLVESKSTDKGVAYQVLKRWPLTI